MMTVAAFFICVGLNACSMATDERCVIALGDNVQFPPHAGHVLVTPDGVRPLKRIDREIEGMINREIARLELRSLSRDYIDEWNLNCRTPAAKLIS